MVFWNILVTEKVVILKIFGIGEHAHIRAFTEHLIEILAEESYSLGLCESRGFTYNMSVV